MATTQTTHRPDRTLLELLLAILVPPVGAYATVGPTGAFWLNVVLTLLGYLPGVVHALWLVSRE